MKRAVLIRELGHSGEDEYGRDRNFHAFQRVRSSLKELEERCQDDELFRDAVTTTLESYSEQLAVLVRAQDRVRRRREKDHTL
jgi:hypothetical protein